MIVRAADPYRDLQVIDRRAPRFNQAVVGGVSLLAVTTGWWWLLALLAAQLLLGLTFGRRFCLPCLLYFRLVQPRLGEGPLEDSRPPRAANIVGLRHAHGCLGRLRSPEPTTLGLALGALVAASWRCSPRCSGLCKGCEANKLACRLRGHPFVSRPLPPRGA